MKPFRSIKEAENMLNEIVLDTDLPVTDEAALITANAIVYIAKCMPLLLKAVDLDNAITGSSMKLASSDAEFDAELIRVLRDAIIKLDMYKRYPEPIPESLKTILDDVSRDFHNILKSLMGDLT